MADEKKTSHRIPLFFYRPTGNETAEDYEQMVQYIKDRANEFLNANKKKRSKKRKDVQHDSKSNQT